jgi:hypothetical protein
MAERNSEGWQADKNTRAVLTWDKLCCEYLNEETDKFTVSCFEIISDLFEAANFNNILDMTKKERFSKEYFIKFYLTKKKTYKKIRLLYSAGLTKEIKVCCNTFLVSTRVQYI